MTDTRKKSISISMSKRTWARERERVTHRTIVNNGATTAPYCALLALCGRFPPLVVGDTGIGVCKGGAERNWKGKTLESALFSTIVMSADAFIAARE